MLRQKANERNPGRKAESFHDQTAKLRSTVDHRELSAIYSFY